MARSDLYGVARRHGLNRMGSNKLWHSILIGRMAT